MVRTTRKQRERLWEVYCRNHPEPRRVLTRPSSQTYRQFRRSVQPTIAMDGAVVLHWCGMWLCIETDGYCHS